MAKRKSFLDSAGAREASNPALNFISEESIKAVEEAETSEKRPEEEAGKDLPLKAPKGYKVNPMYIETKTKRMQLVVQPSLYDRIKEASKKAGLSVNEYCHRVLNEATEEGK